MGGCFSPSCPPRVATLFFKKSSPPSLREGRETTPCHRQGERGGTTKRRRDSLSWQGLNYKKSSSLRDYARGGISLSMAAMEATPSTANTIRV
jgi:hypothetical protein